MIEVSDLYQNEEGQYFVELQNTSSSSFLCNYHIVQAVKAGRSGGEAKHDIRLLCDQPCTLKGNSSVTLKLNMVKVDSFNGYWNLRFYDCDTLKEEHQSKKIKVQKKEIDLELANVEANFDWFNAEQSKGFVYDGEKMSTKITGKFSFLGFLFKLFFMVPFTVGLPMLIHHELSNHKQSVLELIFMLGLGGGVFLMLVVWHCIDFYNLFLRTTIEIAKEEMVITKSLFRTKVIRHKLSEVKSFQAFQDTQSVGKFYYRVRATIKGKKRVTVFPTIENKAIVDCLNQMLVLQGQ